MYELPTSLKINNTDYKIRTDFRIALDIIEAFNDACLSDNEKIIVMLKILYVNFKKIKIEDYEEAINKAIWFLDCGEVDEMKINKPRVMNWEQDFNIIIAPINRVLGYECRAVECLHWWTFIGAYYEIGECTFAHIVSIRNKKRKGKKLERHEQEFYKENKSKIDLKQNLNYKEQELINEILGVK